MTALRTTSTHYTTPYRPMAVRGANGLGRVLGLGRRLDAADLRRDAEKREGLSDYGEPNLDESLPLLCQAINDEAVLHPVGMFITAQRLVGVLRTRLRSEAWRHEHPALEDEVIAPPIVITGLQRTGTTLLHRLLAADPEVRALSSWEAMSPAPPLGWRPGGPEPRRRAARLAQRSLEFLAPDFFAIHPVLADAPEEESLLLDFSLLSPVAEATLHVPSYSRWLAGRDMAPAYRHLASLLRLLQWQRRAPRWVLKTPAHLPFLAELLAILPDAKIVHCHRDPMATLPSYCSMIAHGRGVFSDNIDPLAIGSELLAQQSGMLHAAQRARQKNPRLDAAVIDVAYDDLVASPLAVVERIYRHAGLTLGDTARRAMLAVLIEQTQHRFGKHDYSLEAFGLDAASVEKAFAPYLAQHRALAQPA